MKCGIVGRLYLDHVLYVNSFILGETNNASKIIKKYGGMYNTSSDTINNVDFVYLPESTKEAIIISDHHTSNRTSIIIESSNTKMQSVTELNDAEVDWLHVAYIDDIRNPERLLEYVGSRISIDFCTIANRESYSSIINKASLVFDSRERKSLYDNISTKTPIILHDPFGCECIIKNTIVHCFDNEPSKDINPNGAGDIFAGVFIREYILGGLEFAMHNVCVMTKNILLESYEKI